ncbi:MAG: hypothetical protein KC635_27070 [Myxococcales bacterium]|nr:hypothetical protein [Myxococcales bacterium]
MTSASTTRRALAIAAGAAAAALALAGGGCAAEEPVSAPMGLSVSALTGTACGDPSSPSTGVDPFADIGDISVAVRAFDEESGRYETLAKASTSLKQAASLRVKSVPEGTGREVIVLGKGSQAQWYGKAPGVTVKRNTDNAVDVLLTKLGELSCVPSPATSLNGVFPAAVMLGDGRALVTGGFTEVVADGSGSKLTSPSSSAFLVDMARGTVKDLGSMGAGQGRAAHAMVYMPEVDQVLIVGGLSEMRLDESKPFPFVFTHDDADKARNDYVIFDVATETFRAGTDTMVRGRVFPRAQALADGTVVVTGGGPWPYDDQDAGYLQVSVFAPTLHDGEGGFLDVNNFRSFYTRAGHTLTPVNDTAEGLSQLLVWGGTTPDRSFGNPAEIFVQSGRQLSGVNGTFKEVVITGEVPSFTYFHEATPLTGNRVLMTGGVAYEGGLTAPHADEAWLLTFVDGPSPFVNVVKVPGLGAGRVFHTALSHDLVHVSVLGGFVGLEALTSDTVKLFDVSNTTSAWATAAASATFAPRGGQAAVTGPSGAALLAGGDGSARAHGAQQRQSVEIFTPPTVPVP